MRKINYESNTGYKWVIFSLCFLMIFICMGFASTSKSIFLAPVTEALQIPRSVFSISDSCRFITSAIVNAFFGSLVTRFGTKKLIIGGFTALITSMLIFAFASNVIWFYIAGAVMGIGFSWTSTTMVGSIVMRWCKDGVGTVMGVVLAANGVGSAVATQILTPIIYENGNNFGYKKAYLLIAIIIFVVMLLFLFLYRENKKGAVIQSKKQSSSRASWEGIHIKNAIRLPYFYIMAAFVFLSGMVLQGMISSFAAILKDSGLAPAFVATVVSVYSLCLSFSKVLSGFLYDKFGLKPTVSICNICLVLTILFLLLVNSSGFGSVIAMASAVTVALALPLETVMLPIFAGDLFGIKSYNDILGIFVSISYAGMAIGAPVMNISYDIFGSYDTSLIVSLIVSLVCCIVFLFAVNQSNKHKNTIKRKDTV